MKFRSGVLHGKEVTELLNYANENNIKIHNLGEGYDYNIATEHSYKHYPLSKDIKKIIK